MKEKRRYTKKKHPSSSTYRCPVPIYRRGETKTYIPASISTITHSSTKASQKNSFTGTLRDVFSPQAPLHIDCAK